MTFIIENAKYHTISTSQKELDDSIARAYKKLLNQNLIDRIDYDLIMSLRNVEHETWIKTILNEIIKNPIGMISHDLYSFARTIQQPYGFVEKIETIETEELLKKYIDYFPNGFHSLINRKLSFYAYRFKIPEIWDIYSHESSSWLHIVFFRDRKKQLRLMLPQVGHTNDIKKIEEIKNIFFDLITCLIQLNDEQSLSFYTKQRLRKEGINIEYR